VAGAYHTKTGMYLMIEYFIFKEQMAKDYLSYNKILTWDTFFF